MSFREFIYVQCDACPKHLDLGEDSVEPSTYGTLTQPWASLFSSHSEALRAALREGWYVDAQETQCPDCRAGVTDE